MIGSCVSVGPEFCHQVARSCRPYRRHQNPGAASLLLVRTVAWYKNAKVQKIKECATSSGDFFNHTHFACFHSFQQQYITKASKRILAAEI